VIFVHVDFVCWICGEQITGDGT